MTNRAQQAKSIFVSAIEKYSPEQWPAYLDGVCGDDAPLRKRVEALLEAHIMMGSIHAPHQAATADQARPEPSGVQIGPYKLLQPIGEGGMGVVYMAEQKAPVERRVALKIIKPGMDTRQVIARFEAERQALAMMDHPNIAKVLDAGTTDRGRPYFVMELVKGQPITRFCDEHRLSLRERLELVIPVCQALQHAHQKGVIHRDIKPSNVLIAEYDHQAIPKVIDFGVAKALHQPLTEKTMFTQFGQLVGTLEYMSPEQAKVNQLDIDTRSDVYSLGVLLYELLTAATPFDKDRLRLAAWDEILRIIRDEEPPKPSIRLSSSQTLPAVAAGRGIEPRRLTAVVRGELDWIVMKALEKDRNRRYSSANDLALDLRRHLNGEPVLAGPPSFTYKAGKFIRKHRGPTLAVATVAAALIAGFLATTWLFLQANQQRRLAEQSRGALAVRGAELAQALQEVSRERDEKHLALAAKTSALRDKELALEDRFLALRRANALRLTALSSVELPRNPGRSLLLAIEAARREPDLAAVNNALLAALDECRERSVWDHPAGASRIAVSPNGQRVAVVLTNKTIVIRDADSGRIVSTLGVPGRLPEATTIVFSPDSRRLLTLFQGFSAARVSGERIRVYHDHVARIWDVQDAREAVVLRGHEDRVVAACYSPDGARIATASWDGRARVWDAATGDCLAVCDVRPDQSATDVLEARPSTTTQEDSSQSPVFAHRRPSLKSVQFNLDATRLLLMHDQMQQTSNVTLEGSPAPDIVNPDFNPQEEVLERISSGVGTQFNSLDSNLPVDAVLCETATGLLVRRIALGKNAVPSAATFSHDDRYVLFSLRDKAELLLCDLETGEVTEKAFGVWGKPFYRDSEQIRAVVDAEGPQRRALRTLAVGRTFSPRGDKFLELVEDRVVVKNGESWETICELRGHDEAVRDACFSADGLSVLTSSTDHTLRRWELDARPADHRLIGHTDQVWRARFSPAGDEVVTASRDGKAIVWETRTGAEKLRLERRFAATWKTASKSLAGGLIDAQYSEDGTRIITAADDPLATWEVTDQESRTLPFHPTRIWDARTGQEFMQIPGATLDVKMPTVPENELSNPARFRTRGYADVAVAITPTGEFAVTVDGAENRFIKIEGPDANVTSIGQTGNITFSDGQGNPLGPFHAVRVWKLDSRQLLHRLPCERQGVVPRLSANGLVAITAGLDQAIVWDTVTARERCRLPLDLRSLPDSVDLCLSPGGRWLVVPGSQGTTAALWDLMAGREVHQFESVHEALRFSDDESRLVTANGATAHVWAAPDWQQLATLEGHRYRITGANFSHDGRWIVTFGYDHAARIWRADTGVERVSLAGHTGEVRWAEFSRDGHWIVTASHDQTARIWPFDVLELAEQRRSRELTDDERRRFEVKEPQQLSPPAP